MAQKEIIINQFFGLGDIIFIEPIYRHFYNLGCKVIAPVEDHYYWVKDYIDYVDFRKKSEFPMDYEYFGFKKIDEAEYLPLRFSTPLLRGTDPHSGDFKEHFMLDKYRLLGLPEDLWRNIQWKRNHEKENALFELLGLKEDSVYNLVNTNFGGNFQQFPINVEGIRLAKIDGYTLFDWAKVIENANKIYTVETSVIYLIEVLKLKAVEMHMFPREPWEDTVYGVKNFISPKWVLHEKGNYEL